MQNTLTLRAPSDVVSQHVSRRVVVRTVAMLWLAAAFAAADVGAVSLLPTTVADRLNASSMPKSALGVAVVRVSDGKTLWSHNADVAMQPASTLKVLTSIVALDTLTPPYRGRAELRSVGAVVDGVHEGTLFLKGFASPDFDWQALQAMLVTLKHKGVHEIRGDMILDRSFFNPLRPDLGVPPFDESPEFRYNVIPDALMLNSNLQQLEITSSDDVFKITPTPALDRVSIVSDMTLVDQPCTDWEDVWKIPRVEKNESGEIRVTLQGDFPRNCPVTTSISVLDRVDFADRLFRALWSTLGGRFTGTMRDGVMPESAKLIAEHQSRTLAEINRDINKRSDNPMTRMMYFTLGTDLKSAVADSAQTTAARADRVIRAWLAARSIDAKGLVLDNGSGLSRSERIMPITLAQVLREARRSQWAPEFLMSLPIVGFDGAMRKRFVDGPAVGRARFKTGYIRNVVTVAGYIHDARGEEYAVVAMLNHENVKGRDGKVILDEVLDWVSKTDMRKAVRHDRVRVRKLR